MTNFRRALAAFGLALLLVAIPFVVGAQNDGTHRSNFSEDTTAPDDGIAVYAMIQLDELETIAGRQNLDQETIQFLEANLWLLEPTADYAAVGETAHTAFCQGEGLVDTANRVALFDGVDSIRLYCSPNARFATYEATVLLPTGDIHGDQANPY